MLDEKEVAIEGESVLTKGIQCALSSMPMVQKEYIWESYFIPDG
jgi:hypothetical protein